MHRPKDYWVFCPVLWAPFPSLVRGYGLLGLELPVISPLYGSDPWGRVHVHAFGGCLENEPDACTLDDGVSDQVGGGGLSGTISGTIRCPHLCLPGSGTNLIHIWTEPTHNHFVPALNLHELTPWQGKGKIRAALE